MAQFGPAKEVNRLGHVTEFERKMAARGDEWDNEHPWSSWSPPDWKGCPLPRDARAHRRAPAVLPPCSHLGSWLASRSHPPLGVFAPHPLTPLRPHRGRWKKSQSPMVKGSKPSKRTHTKNWLEWFMDFVKERMGLMEPHQKHHFYIADTKKKPNGIAKV